MRASYPEPRPRLSLDEAAAAAEVLRAGDWSRAGDDWPLSNLDRLEERWAAHHGTKEAVAVSSGTSGLTLALRALGVPAGDEVLLPVYGCPAVDVAVWEAGLTPVHVEIDPATYCMSPAAAAAAVTPRTAALLAVHFAGQPASLGSLARIADRCGLALLEDACLAPGARFLDRSAGGWGHAAVFSLGVRKPVSCGEGGAVTTSDARLAETVRRLRSLGTDPESGEILRPSGNARMTELQAAVALPQLERLEPDIARREEAARRLTEAAVDVPGLLPLETVAGVTRHTRAQFWLRLDEEAAGVTRDWLVRAVQAEGVPFFPGWTRPAYCHAFYTPERAREWLRERGSGREPDHYQKTRCPIAERAAFKEAMVLDFPVLDAEPEVIADTAEALGKVGAWMRGRR